MGDRVVEQVEQVPFGLADAAADRRQFHRAGLSAQMAFGLVSADDTPAQRGQHQPPVKRGPVDGGPAGFFVGVKKISRCCPGRRRRGRAARRTARPGCRTRPGLRRPRRRAPAPSPARRPGRIRRRSGCPSGSRRAPACGGDGAGRLAASQRNAHSKVAVVSPMVSSRSRHSTSWSSWVRPGQVRVGAVDGGERLRALTQQLAPGRRRRAGAGCDGRWSRRRSRRRSETDCRVRQQNRRRPARGGPARRRQPRRPGRGLRVPCRRARRRAVRCAGSAIVVAPPVTASNAQVVRLAPPVSARRLSIAVPAPRAGSSTAASLGASSSATLTCGRT